jgi:hypothetical protein
MVMLRMEPTDREKRIKRLWNGTFIVWGLLILSLVPITLYTDYNTEPLVAYAFGSMAIAWGCQLVVFGQDYDQIIARDLPGEWFAGVKLPARLFGVFFILIGVGLIAMA